MLHTAGPFQRKNSQLVLETAIAMGIPYVDVCDDAEYAQDCKRLHQRAVDAGVPAITTAGIYPGKLPSPNHCLYRPPAQMQDCGASAALGWQLGPSPKTATQGL